MLNDYRDPSIAFFNPSCYQAIAEMYGEKGMRNESLTRGILGLLILRKSVFFLVFVLYENMSMTKLI